MNRPWFPTLLIILGFLCSSVEASADGALAARLDRHLRTTGPHTRIPVVVAFDEPASASRAPTRGKQGLAALRSRARQHESAVRTVLSSRIANGETSHIRSLWITNAVALEATPGAIRELTAIPGVRRVIWDKPEKVLIDPPAVSPANTPLELSTAAADTGWGVLKIGAPAAWQSGYRGQGVIVAVLDTGIDWTHPDLQNRIWINPGEIPDNMIDDDGNGYVDDVHGYNFADTLSNPADDHGHGTRVSGIICGDGTADTLTGVAPEATVMAVKVLTSEGGAQQADVWEGIQYAIDNGAHVMNLSIGWRQSAEPDRTMWRMACDNALAAGVVMVAASGNERDNGIPAPDNTRTPGDVPSPMTAPTPSGVVTSGGTDADDVVAYYSSYGPVQWADVPPWHDHPYPPGLVKPDVVAPGLFINTTAMGGVYTGPNQHGTSMATPHVAGAVALLLSAKPWLTPFEVDSLLEETALDIFTPGKDNLSGSGRVQADSLVGAVASAVEDNLPPTPALTVWQNYPNPFNPITTIRFELARAMRVGVDIFDIAGRKVSTLANREFVAGSHTVVWNGTDDAGTRLASGVYVYRVSAGGTIHSGTMVLLK